MNGKALMTYYAEGSLISRELNDMMTSYAAEVRFDLEMADDLELYGDRQAVRPEHYNRTPRSLIKEGLIS